MDSEYRYLLREKDYEGSKQSPKSGIMDKPVEDVTRVVITDLIVLCVFGLIELVISKFINPFHRGFFCDDTSIRYPEFKSTVPAIVLNIVGTSVPLLIILFAEWNQLKRKRNPPVIHKFLNKEINEYAWNVYRMVTCFGLGALFCLNITDIGKKVVGRLRPNFFDVCKPSPSVFELCKNSTVYNYIQDIPCTVDADKSRVSFPSGHSSYSFYCAVFLVIYLEKVWKTRKQLTKPIVQFFFIALAWFVALSRVMNNKHHWSDVCAGIIIGVTCAVINCLYVFRLLEEKPISAHLAINRQPTTTPGVSGVPTTAAFPSSLNNGNGAEL